MTSESINTFFLPRAPVLLAALVVLSGCLSNGSGRGGGSFRDTVVCMCYNVENLFDAVEDGGEYDEYIPGRGNWNQETCSRKLGNIAAAIAAADADIVVLCEIENRRVLRMLLASLKRRRCGYRYYEVGDRPNPSSVSTAVLSRLPITGRRCHGIPARDGVYTRNILEVDVRLAAACTLKVFANHWPSKHNPESHRIAAANVLARRLAQLPPGTDYVLAGDFNSNYNECATFAGTKLDDSRGETGINHVLRTVLSAPGESTIFATEAFIADSQPGGYHYNLWLELPMFRRLNYMYRTKPETPDDFLVPASLYDRAGVSYVDNSFRVFRWNGRLIFGGKPYRWQFAWGKNGKRHIGDGYSDHLPLLMNVRVGPFEPAPELSQAH